MRLPSRFVIIALRQIFLASILKAYTDSSNALGEKIKLARYQMLISVEFHRDIR